MLHCVVANLRPAMLAGEGKCRLLGCGCPWNEAGSVIEIIVSWSVPPSLMPQEGILEILIGNVYALIKP